MRAARALIVALVFVGLSGAASSAPASASVCGAVGWINGAAGKACGVITNGDKLVSAGKKLASGHLGGAAKTLLGGGGAGAGSKAVAIASLAAIGAWVTGGARVALTDTAKVLGETTDPRLGSTWFSATYWRMAAIAAVLTLPFLFAAAVQALLRSDLALLARAALGYLPLSLLAVGIAAPLATLLLAACDEMSAIVSSAAGHAGTHFLERLGTITGGLIVVARSPFLAFLVGLLTAGAAIALWIELLIREAAVYIVVLMMPLAFAALVWPARRVWTIRAVELLVALILSKFAIVAVLALGGAALDHASRPTGMLTGLVLIILGAFAPWALMRLLPLAEVAGGAAEQLRGGLSRAHRTFERSDEALSRAENWAGTLTAGMRREADSGSSGFAGFSGFAGSGGAGSGGAGSGGAGSSAGSGGAGAELEQLPAPSRDGTGASPGETDPVMVSEPAPVDIAADDADGEDETVAEPPPGRWEGSVAADEGRWRVPPLGPQMLDGRPFWEAADEPDRRPPAAGSDRRPLAAGSGPRPPAAEPDPPRSADEPDPRPPEQEPGEGYL
jgi:hypothetical protein